MQIVPYTAGHREMWDDFVAGSRNGTFFHTRRFLSYHPEDRFEDTSLLFMDDAHPLAVLPAAVKEEDGKKWLMSHPGASYGGLVLSPRAGMRETGEITEMLLAYAREQGFYGIKFFRLTPPSVRRIWSDDQEYWLFQRGWSVFRIELATTLFLIGQTKESLFLGYSDKCRNKVRQAHRSGLTVRQTTDFAAFWPIVEAMLQGRHGAKPTHTLPEIQHLAELCPDDVRLFGAFDGDRMVAGTVAMTLHDRAVYTLYMAQDYAHQDKRPMHLIVDHLAKVCLQEGRSALHFGISTEDGGAKVNDGLFSFKESFGGRSVRRESWQCVF